VRRWGVSIGSLTMGLATLFVFRGGLPHLGWIVGYLLLLWLIVAVLAQARAPLETRGQSFMVSAAEYTIQTLYHNLLLFVLPAYWASATLTSPNALFLAGIAAGAFVTAVDPLYGALARGHGWIQHAFLGFSMFAALNVALPLIGLPPYGALIASAFAASLAVTPVVRRASGRSWAAALRITLALGVVAATLAALGRGWIPPAPLFIARAAIVWDVPNLESIEALASPVSAAEVKERGLVAYTAIYAPAGLRQSVGHVWRHRGRVIEVVSLAPVLGGRREGYRTYSRKTSFPEDSEGRWSVDVVTASGQLIGRLRFRIVR